MKRTAAYIIVGLLFFTAFSEISWAAGGYNINPATVPPSLRREGLVRSPGTAVGSGNLLITGNIRGPAYFRGIVPYSAPTDFGVTLPSSSLDSFLRDSAGSESFGGYNSYSGYGPRYRPYYSPTQTVSSTIPRYYAQGRVSAANIDAYSAQSYLSGTLPVRRDSVLDAASATSLARWRPMSMTPEEMQKIISSEIAKYSPGRLTQPGYQPKTGLYNPELRQESYKAGELRTGMPGMEGSLLLPVVRKPGEVNQPFGIPGQAGEAVAQVPFGTDMNTPLNVYDQMQQQIDSLQTKINLALVTPQPQKDAEEGEKSAGEQTGKGFQAERLAEVNLPASGIKAAFGPYETFASFSEDKFNQNMRAAEIYLKQGRYYRAADAYTLASLYKPDDPLAYAGKSHALFAAGEYMSSALFLSRALRIFPGYARFKIDIVAMVGDRDKLETRVVDVEEWLTRTDAPELQFLLAYVYYQMGRPVPAKEAIDAAYEKMPDSSVVLALKQAIEESPSPAAGEGGLLRITEPAAAQPSLPAGQDVISDASKE
ncbi:MAG: hypothetical protein PHQ35_07775 [Phycisphaerae bacterium]|nr:hypothetical protein [Phycisphaerae bacterium]MDD5380060.1 hypothetical protein [Phycisphaerae bacterium]